MDDKIEMTPEEDEVILCVRYTRMLPRCLLAGGCAILAAFGLYACYCLILRQDYLLGTFGIPGGLLLVLASVDGFLTKHILFYRDRLTKAWYFLGERTIPYTRTKLFLTPRSLRWTVWPAKQRLGLREVDERGRMPMIQVPIGFCYLCMSKETIEKAEAIVTYLLGLEDGSELYEESRVFVRSTLPKEWS